MDAHSRHRGEVGGSRRLLLCGRVIILLTICAACDGDERLDLLVVRVAKEPARDDMPVELDIGIALARDAVVDEWVVRTYGRSAVRDREIIDTVCEDGNGGEERQCTEVDTVLPSVNSAQLGRRHVDFTHQDAP
jgi:hypothetical protein